MRASHAHCSPFFGGAAESAAPQPEPGYDGKPLSSWVLGDTNSLFRSDTFLQPGCLGRDAEEAVKNIGTNAIPFLLKWLEPPSPRRAVNAFRLLGPAARSAIPALAKLATNPPPPNADSQTLREVRRCQEAALDALGSVGPRGIPIFCAVATNRAAGADARTSALAGIAGIGTNALAATPVLLQCLKDEDKEVVRVALIAFNRMRPKDPEVFLAVLECLESPEPQMRRNAVDALAPFADSAFPALYRAVCSDEDKFVRIKALQALASLGNRALPGIAQGLKDSDDRVRGAALDVLVGSVPCALTNASVLKLAAEWLTHPAPDGSRQKYAALLLRAAGQQAQGAKPNLLPSRDWDLVLAGATNVLRQLAPSC